MAHICWSTIGISQLVQCYFVPWTNIDKKTLGGFENFVSLSARPLLFGEKKTNMKSLFLWNKSWCLLNTTELVRLHFITWSNNMCMSNTLDDLFLNSSCHLSMVCQQWTIHQNYINPHKAHSKLGDFVNVGPILAHWWPQWKVYCTTLGHCWPWNKIK